MIVSSVTGSPSSAVCTESVLVMRFTCTFSSPGTFFTLFSTCMAHDEQVIPLTSYSLFIANSFNTQHPTWGGVIYEKFTTTCHCGQVVAHIIQMKMARTSYITRGTGVCGQRLCWCRSSPW